MWSRCQQKDKCSQRPRSHLTIHLLDLILKYLARWRRGRGVWDILNWSHCESYYQMPCQPFAMHGTACSRFLWHLIALPSPTTECQSTWLVLHIILIMDMSRACCFTSSWAQNTMYIDSFHSMVNETRSNHGCWTTDDLSLSLLHIRRTLSVCWLIWLENFTTWCCIKKRWLNLFETSISWTVHEFRTTEMLHFHNMWHIFRQPCSIQSHSWPWSAALSWAQSMR